MLDTVPQRFGHRPGNDKCVREGTHRTTALETTIERVLDRRDALGLTRLSDLQDLDILGIPNYAAICPMVNFPPQPGCVSVFSGKGLTREHARASALMEAAERYSCRDNRRFTLLGSYAQLAPRHNVLDPREVVVPDSWAYDPQEVTEWVGARSLLQNDVVLVPAWMAFTPYVPRDHTHRPYFSSTNGVASGNTLEEAALHAIYEVIERDAEAIALSTGRSRRLDLDQLPAGPLTDLVGRFNEHGVRLTVHVITQDIRVHTMLATSIDPSLPTISYANGGKGTSLDPAIAFARAVTEVSQSRVTGMAGIREDMRHKRSQMAEADVDELVRAHGEWFAGGSDDLRLDDLEDRSTTSIVDDLVIALDELRAAGVPDVLLIDLTRPELEVPVARIIVPHLEFEHAGNWMGPRLQRLVETEAGGG